MEMEARSFSPERARVLLQKVKEYKADLATLRADAKKVSLAGACWMCSVLAVQELADAMPAATQAGTNY